MPELPPVNATPDPSRGSAHDAGETEHFADGLYGEFLSKIDEALAAWISHKSAKGEVARDEKNSGQSVRVL